MKAVRINSKLTLVRHWGIWKAIFLDNAGSVHTYPINAGEVVIGEAKK